MLFVNLSFFAQTEDVLINPGIQHGICCVQPIVYSCSDNKDEINIIQISDYSISY